MPIPKKIMFVKWKCFNIHHWFWLFPFTKCHILSPCVGKKSDGRRRGRGVIISEPADRLNTQHSPSTSVWKQYTNYIKITLGCKIAINRDFMFSNMREQMELMAFHNGILITIVSSQVCTLVVKAIGDVICFPLICTIYYFNILYTILNYSYYWCFPTWILHKKLFKMLYFFIF